MASKTTKTTTTKTIKYQPVASRRTTVVQRSSGVPTFGSSVERSMSYGMSMAPAPSSYTNVTNLGMANVRETRDQEKKDMRDLNERFSNYIEKVRFLEAQNKKLAEELERLKSRWGQETTKIKEMYDTEMTELREQLNDAEKARSEADVKIANLSIIRAEDAERIANLEEQAEEAKENLEKLTQENADTVSELILLRKRNENLQTENDNQKREIIRLSDIIKKLRFDLDAETMNHINASNQVQSLEDEIEFMKRIHEQEMKELAALVYKDSTSENREFWKNEMGNALKEVQSTYDDKMDQMRAEMENFYSLKLQEYRTGATKQNLETVNAKEEVKRLRTVINDLRDKNGQLDADLARLKAEYDRKIKDLEDDNSDLTAENDRLTNEVGKLRAEIECIIKEMEGIMDAKLSMELEIAAYRKLLEGEENRIGLREIVSSMVSSSAAGGGGSYSAAYGSGFSGGQQEYVEDDDGALRVSQVVKGEMQARTTFQRSAKGHIQIKECASNGGAIVLENTQRREESISGWTIKRTCDGKEVEGFTFPKNTYIRGMGTFKVISDAADSNQSKEYDLSSGLEDFGTGGNITTLLLNDKAQEKASHIQKTTYK